MGGVGSPLLEALEAVDPDFATGVRAARPLDISAELRDKLLTVSAATMDRLLSEVRIVARGGGRRRTGMSSAVRRSVPVRTFGDWNDPVPGYVEVDFVAHSGTSSSGSFVQTMVLTDIATGWTECVPVRSRDSSLVVAAHTDTAHRRRKQRHRHAVLRFRFAPPTDGNGAGGHNASVDAPTDASGKLGLGA